MDKTMRFEVVFDNIPEWMTVAYVQEQLEREITHPWDAAFDADIEVHRLMDEEGSEG